MISEKIAAIFVLNSVKIYSLREVHYLTMEEALLMGEFLPLGQERPQLIIYFPLRSQR